MKVRHYTEQRKTIIFYHATWFHTSLEEVESSVWMKWPPFSPHQSPMFMSQWSMQEGATQKQRTLFWDSSRLRITATPFGRGHWKIKAVQEMDEYTPFSYQCILLKVPFIRFQSPFLHRLFRSPLPTSASTPCSSPPFASSRFMAFWKLKCITCPALLIIMTSHF